MEHILGVDFGVSGGDKTATIEPFEYMGEMNDEMEIEVKHFQKGDITVSSISKNKISDIEKSYESEL